jgi:hypothetical protein
MSLNSIFLKSNGSTRFLKIPLFSGKNERLLQTDKIFFASSVRFAPIKLGIATIIFFGILLS